MKDDVVTNEMALEALKWIVHDIWERKAEADKLQKNSDFQEGRALAYFEVTDMIKSRLEIMNVNLEEATKEVS